MSEDIPGIDVTAAPSGPRLRRMHSDEGGSCQVK
jgi:hypothetical protein